MSAEGTRAANATAMEKVSSTDFSTGAQLTPEQFDDFLREVQDQSTVLQQARMVPVTAESGKIPRVNVGSRLLRAVTESNSTAKNTIASGDISYATSKVSLPWEQTWEANNEIIDNPEATVRQLFINQFGLDLEILASVGDSANADPFVSIEDGWLTRADARLAIGNQVDHQTAAINKTLFNEMATAMPQRFREQQTPVFLTSDAQKQAYKDYLTDRSTGAGDAMLMTGDEPTPYGYNILTPLAWPDDRAMFTSMENLLYIVQDDMRVKSTQDSERNVMNDVETIYNLLAKVDFEIGEEDGVVTASNIAAP